MEANRSNALGARSAGAAAARRASSRRLGIRMAFLALLAGLAVLAIGNAPSAQSSAASGAPGVYAFRPGVWFDAARGRAYLMVPGGGFEAVDLATGRALWRRGELDKPLLVTQDWVLGMRSGAADRISFARVDVAGEPRLRWSSGVELPPGVRSGIDQERATLFHAQACSRSGDRAGVVWRFDRVVKPKRSPVPGETATRSEGSLLIALASGEIEEVSERACPAVSTEAAGRTLAPGSVTASGATVRYASADGRHFLASRAAADGLRFDWEIHSTGTGERVARIAAQEQVGAWFVVRDSLLIHDVPPIVRARAGGDGTSEAAPPRIRAISLASGDERWSREYRDTRYQADLGSDPGREEEEEAE